MNFLSTREDGVCELVGGLIEFDPRWRERTLLSQLEPSSIGRKRTRAEYLAGLACETGVFFISGRPGGGKSLLATKMIVDELMKGHRPIVTNLALNLSRLQEYLLELGSDCHVLERVRLLEHDECFQFYRYRGAELLLPLNIINGKEILDFEISQKDHWAAGGVFYVIDEVHNYVNTKTRVDEDTALYQWSSQHRKLKDSCYLVTQSIESVHVKVRRLAQSYYYVRNLRREKFKGFRRGDGFEISIFPFIPSDADKRTLAPDRFPLNLDVRGLASCYFTAAGVGVAAIGTGDGGFAKKGFNVKWLWWGLALAILAGLSLVFIVPHVMQAWVSGQGKKIQSQVAGREPASKLEAKKGEGPAKGVSPEPDSSPKSTIFCDGFMMVEGQPQVHIRDYGWIPGTDQGAYVQTFILGRVPWAVSKIRDLDEREKKKIDHKP